MPTVHRRRYKGQANRTALALFGSPKRMETPEDRESMALVLLHSSQPAIKMLAQQALDPTFKHTSFGKLAENNGLNIHMLSDEFKAIHKSIGMIRAAPIVQELIVQAAEDARSRDEKCHTCKGTGQVLDTALMAKGKKEAEARGEEFEEAITRECDACHGEGTRYVLGDLDRLKMTFETFGLTSKGGGLNLNLDLRKPPDAHESMAELSASVAPILEGNK
jgi:hypothetical protein